MHDLASNIGVVSSLAPTVLAATTKGNPVSLQGFGSVVMTIATGAITGSGAFKATLEHSDTTLDADFSAVNTADMIGEPPPSPLPANSVFKVGYIGTKPFVRVALTKDSGTSLAASVVAVLGHPALAPVA